MIRGEVWLINLDPTVGAEIQKIRPAVVVNDDAIGILPLKIVVPITDWKDRYSLAPWMTRINPDSCNGLSKCSAADAFQVRSLSQQRFIKKIGSLPDTVMMQINEALAIVLGLQ